MRKRRPKHTLEQITAYFDKAGCTLLNTVYLGSKQELRYRCKCGAIRFTCFNNFVRGHRCMKCHLKQFEFSKNKQRLRNLKIRSNLFTINDLARIMCVSYGSLWTAIRISKIIPEPTHSSGSVRKYYSQRDVSKILRTVELE
jgi:hypothetical protein